MGFFFQNRFLLMEADLSVLFSFFLKITFLFILGMDPTNERRVFDMIVNMLSSDVGLAKTQYFL